MANHEPLLSGVSETLLIPLQYRALESQRPSISAVVWTRALAGWTGSTWTYRRSSSCAARISAVKGLVTKLREAFPGAELVFDA